MSLARTSDFLGYLFHRDPVSADVIRSITITKACWAAYEDNVSKRGLFSFHNLEELTLVVDDNAQRVGILLFEERKEKVKEAIKKEFELEQRRFAESKIPEIFIIS